MAAIRFYLDENVPVAIAEQLKRHHIEVFTVRDPGELGDNDESHLSRATAMGCVLCTHDADFVMLATSVVGHVGIVFGQQEKHTIGVGCAYCRVSTPRMSQKIFSIAFNFCEY